jgi:IS1 family transposase
VRKPVKYFAQSGINFLRAPTTPARFAHYGRRVHARSLRSSRSSLGSRDAITAYELMQDVAGRLRHSVQLTTDSHRPYLQAVEAAFRTDIDYAILQKIYGADPGAEKRYSPAVCIGWKAKEISGSPDPKHVSTSYVERQNLTMRMSMRRFTGLTNAFSKKVDNHAAAVALYFMYYKFGRVEQTLRVTPRDGNCGADRMRREIINWSRYMSPTRARARALAHFKRGACSSVPAGLRQTDLARWSRRGPLVGA